METIKAYGSRISTATNKALVTLNEKLKMSTGEHKKDHFLSLNPFGQVPALEHGDLKLFESRVITKYVAYEYANKGTQLIHQHSKKMAITLVWMEVEAQQYDPVASKLVWELGIKPLVGKVTDKAIVEENEAKLAKVLDVYENRLAPSKYLRGDCFTLADLHHLPTLQYLLGTQSQKLFDSRPHVSAWVADITARPAWLKVQAMRNKH